MKIPKIAIFVGAILTSLSVSSMAQTVKESPPTPPPPQNNFCEMLNGRSLWFTTEYSKKRITFNFTTQYQSTRSVEKGYVYTYSVSGTDVNGTPFISGSQCFFNTTPNLSIAGELFVYGPGGHQGFSINARINAYWEIVESKFYGFWSGEDLVDPIKRVP